MRGFKFAVAVLALLLLADAAHDTKTAIGTIGLSIARGPFISGSRLQLTTTVQNRPVAFYLFGPGELHGSLLIAPTVGARENTGVIAASQGAIAYQEFAVLPPPPPKTPLLAVTSYDRGVVLHDPRTFAIIGYIGIGGPPGDAAFARDGSVISADTDGLTLTWANRAPWSVRTIEGVLLGNEVAVDWRTGNAFVSDRDVGGPGAVTRVTQGGAVTRLITGETAEGLAIDSRRGLIYVGNVNDNTVAEVDETSMTIARKLRSPLRTFGIALDRERRHLLVVANISSDMHSGRGFVAAIDLNDPLGGIVARSAGMTFPLGVAIDGNHSRAFVTDESADIVYVLSALTLRQVRAPLQTCTTPWRPLVAGGRLYVPCARSNAVDVFDLSTLRRLHGAPFATGGYPLSVASWP